MPNRKKPKYDIKSGLDLVIAKHEELRQMYLRLYNMYYEDFNEKHYHLPYSKGMGFTSHLRLEFHKMDQDISRLKQLRIDSFGPKEKSAKGA